MCQEVCGFKNYESFTFAVTVGNFSLGDSQMLKAYAQRIANGESIEAVEKDALAPLWAIYENLKIDGQKLDGNYKNPYNAVIAAILAEAIRAIDIYDVLEAQIKDIEAGREV
jgi:hypothetical protein